jgi:hemoglobin
MKYDIQEPKDIQLLLDSFYAKVLVDDVIGFIFRDIARIDLPTHMPVLYAFWETVLLGMTSYKGNAISKHIELNRLIPLTDAHFERWKQLFFETIDELFEGKIALLAKEKANGLQMLMQLKIRQSQQPGFIQ